MPDLQAQASIKTETSQPSFSLSQKQKRVPLRKIIGWRAASRILLARLQDYLETSKCIWIAAFRSFRAHIRTQSAKGGIGVYMGLALVETPSGSFEPNPRTIARSLYIEMLQATHAKWADSVDLRIFLMGFDAGEQWALHTADKENDKRPDIASWLTCTEQSCGYIPSKIIQPSNAFNSQTSEATPAAIAGVTGNGECYAAEIIGVQIPFVYSSALGSSSDSNHFLRTFRFFARILCPMVDACFLRSSSLSCKAMSIVS